MLNRAGHKVTVYERADRIGGLLMYGIPNMKLDKQLVDRRLDLLRRRRHRVRHRCRCRTTTSIPANSMAENDALLLATGATQPAICRSRVVTARDPLCHGLSDRATKTLLDHPLTMEPVRRICHIDARDKDVIVIGGGDTGTDCIGTAMRQRCRSLVNFELLPRAARRACLGQSLARLAQNFPYRLRPRRSDQPVRKGSTPLLHSLQGVP